MAAVRNVIDKSLAERDANVDRFCTHVDKDIASLGRDVREIKQKAQDPKILDSSSQSEDIIQYLGVLQEKMDELQQTAFTYKSYQKNFKVRLALLGAGVALGQPAACVAVFLSPRESCCCCLARHSHRLPLALPE